MAVAAAKGGRPMRPRCPWTTPPPTLRSSSCRCPTSIRCRAWSARSRGSAFHRGLPMLRALPRPSPSPHDQGGLRPDRRCRGPVRSI